MLVDNVLRLALATNAPPASNSSALMSRLGLRGPGVTFSVIAGSLGRAFPPEKRSMALGISAAAGSFGQFALLPFTQLLLSHIGWVGALTAMSVVALAMATGILIIPNAFRDGIRYVLDF